MSENNTGNDHKTETARNALELHVQITDLTSKLTDCKDELRRIAAGETLKIAVPGVGEVSVSKPRKGGNITGTKMALDEDKLNAAPDLKKKMIDKGLIIVSDIISTPASASITLKPNV